MFEKLLLAVTITFSLSLFISIGTQSSTQGTLTSSPAGNLLEMAKIPQDRAPLNRAE